MSWEFFSQICNIFPTMVSATAVDVDLLWEKNIVLWLKNSVDSSLA